MYAVPLNPHPMFASFINCFSPHLSYVPSVLSGVPSHLFFLVHLLTCSFWCTFLLVLSGEPSHLFFLVYLLNCSFWCTFSTVLSGLPSQLFLLVYLLNCSSVYLLNCSSSHFFTTPSKDISTVKTFSNYLYIPSFSQITISVDLFTVLSQSPLYFLTYLNLYLLFSSFFLSLTPLYLLNFCLSYFLNFLGS